MRFPAYELPGLTPEQNAVYARNLHEIEQNIITVERGVADATFGGTNDSTGSVSFSAAFPSTNVVIFLTAYENQNLDLVASVKDKTSTGFGWRLRQVDGVLLNTTARVQWQAFSTSAGV